MLDIYTNCKIRLTRDQSIPWEKQCLVLCVVYKYFKAVPSAVLTAADRVDLLWQCRGFSGYHHRHGGHNKRQWKLTDSHTWIPLTLMTEKYVKENQLSHILNLILESCAPQLTAHNLWNTQVFSSIWILYSVSWTSLLTTILIATISVQPLKLT